MKRAGYRPYQRQRSCEQTHLMSGRGTHQACFIYHVINLVVGVAKRSLLILNRWCGWNRIPAPTSPTITYNVSYRAPTLIDHVD